jgi:hypothetical protein
MNRRRAEEQKFMPVCRVDPACLTFASTLVSTVEYECPSAGYSLHPYFGVEAFTLVFEKPCVLISLYSRTSETHWCLCLIDTCRQQL